MENMSYDFVDIKEYFSTPPTLLQFQTDSIKVLIIYPFPFHPMANPFLRILADELERYFMVDIGVDNFWKKDFSYDIIHFHWPEAIFNWNIPSKKDQEELKKTITIWKDQGAKIIFTRHNIRPHLKIYRENENKTYSIIEENSDCIVHMGYWSKNEFIQKNHIQTFHTIIPHHIYLNYKSPWISKNRARDYFGIPYDKLVILAFGKFRNDEERVWTLKAFENIINPNKVLIAPRFGEFPLPKTKEKDYYFLNDIFVNNEELPFYFEAADIVFIQRLQILNSGNLSMAFLFNKVVVGPDMGNVGEILQKTNNFSFMPGDLDSVGKAFDGAVEKVLSGECKNYEYAIRHWSIKRIGNKYRKLFHQLTN